MTKKVEENLVSFITDKLMELEMYKILCGEMVVNYKGVDTVKAFEEYNNLEPKRKEFADYVEKLVNKQFGKAQ